MNEIYKTNAVKALQKIDNYNNSCVFYTELDHNYTIDDTIFIYIQNNLNNYDYTLFNYLDSYNQYNLYSIIGYKILSIEDNKIILDIKYDLLFNIFSGNTSTMNTSIKNSNIYISKILTNNCFFNKNYDNIDLIINSTILNNSTFYNDDLSKIIVKQAIFINIYNTLKNISFDYKYTSDYLTTNYELDDLNNISIFFTFNNRDYGYIYFIDVNITNSINIKNGIFLSRNTTFDTKITNSNIYNGYYEYYLLEKDIMYYSYCKNCKLTTDNVGLSIHIWYDGIWNNNLEKDNLGNDYFIYNVWLNGFWINGNTSVGIKWENGTFNNGLFLNGIWENGTFNNGEFYNSVWKKGVFNNGLISSSSIWYSGIMNGGKLLNSIFNNGTINNGFIEYDSTIDGSNTIINYCIFNNGTILNSTIKNCIFNNGLIEKSVWYNGEFYNGTFLNSLWKYGTFYDGYFYSGSTFENGIINNGLFEYSILDATNHKDIIINFANIKNTYMKKVIVNNAIINNSTVDLFEYSITSGNDGGNYYYYYNGDNETHVVKFCYMDDCIFNYSIFNDGVVSSNSLWYDGQFNFGIFEESSIWYGGKFYDGYFRGDWKGGVYYTGDPTITITGTTINSPDIDNYKFKIFNGNLQDSVYNEYTDDSGFTYSSITYTQYSATTYYMVPLYEYKNSKSFKQYNDTMIKNTNKNTNYSTTHIDEKGRFRRIKQNYTQEDIFNIKKTNDDLTKKQQSVFDEIYTNLQNLNSSVFPTSDITTSGNTFPDEVII